MSVFTGKAQDLWKQFLLLWDSCVDAPKYVKEDWRTLSEQLQEVLRVSNLDRGEQLVSLAQSLSANQGGNPSNKKNPDKHLTWIKHQEDLMTYNFRNKQLVKEYTLPNGCSKKAFVTHAHDFVIGMALTPDNKQIILCREYRPGPEKIILDMPTGSINDKELPHKAMARELREETGFEGDEPIFVNTTHVGPYTTQKRHTFVIKNCRQVGPQQLDKDEFIEVVTMPVEQYLHLVKLGQTTNAAAVFYCLDFLGKITCTL